MLSDLLQVVADALASGTPFADHPLHARLAADERQALAAVDPDGFAVTRVLVRKLRAERVLLGDRELAAECERDAATFMAEYKEYERTGPAASSFPEDEAAAFRGWRAGRTPPDPT